MTWPETPERLPFPVVDNHCHMDMPPRDVDVLSVDEALDRAAAVNITRIVQVGCDLPGARWAVETAKAYDSVVAAVALHPNEAPRLAEAGKLEEALAEIDSLAGSGDYVRAIGETGLDYFRTGDEGKEAQHHSFREHIRMAKRHNKALMIHDRDAHADVLEVLDDEGIPDRTVMHCFSGDADFAMECVERGAFLSYAGTVTFKNAANLREALLVTPRDRILVETDAPFLTPSPHRGQPNASYLIPLTVRLMAETLGISADDLCRDISANTDRAYGGTWPERI
ncbi:TatD DNase family protein [Aeromicrobium panaciterrae]|uniref:TatD DNase family protein n=1 Tax=Aeromicrobium panaciterrae TaxID=363861 RepID=A0ABU1ULP0_9ACTN|nr:TatD DNase family protein [Aeromicrobium panaciterrae]